MGAYVLHGLVVTGWSFIKSDIVTGFGILLKPVLFWYQEFTLLPKIKTCFENILIWFYCKD